MRPSRHYPAELMTIGLFAPIVVGARLQMLALEAVKPTARGRREAMGMVTEKPLAWLEGAFAIQAEMLRRSVQVWPTTISDFMKASTVPMFALTAIGARPISRKVDANARRLARRRL